MPPNVSSRNTCVEEQNSEDLKRTNDFHTEKQENSEVSQVENEEAQPASKRWTIAQILGLKAELIWTNIILITLLHALSVYYLLTFPYLSHKKLLVYCESNSISQLFQLSNNFFDVVELEELCMNIWASLMSFKYFSYAVSQTSHQRFWKLHVF